MKKNRFLKKKKKVEGGGNRKNKLKVKFEKGQKTDAFQRDPRQGSMKRP